MRVFCSIAMVMLFVGAVLSTAGCMKSTETAGANELTEGKVGIYPPAPAGITRPKVGCPPWTANAKSKDERVQIGTEAGDIGTTLIFKTKRVRVIERNQLPQLLKEQALEGIVKPEEMAKSGQVKGIDFLLYGKITNFRVKKESAKRGFGLGRIGAIPGVRGACWFGLLDVKKSSQKITVEIGVVLRMVDPTSGEVVVAEQAEFKKTDSISALGRDIRGANATSEAKMKIEKDNRGLLLRLAIDHAIRKMLPDLDNFTQNDFKPKTK